MKNIQWKSLVPHLIAVIVFLVVALVYCKPALEGKVLQQTDITQWKAMAQNAFVYEEKHGHSPLWTNGMFSGMPNFQITGVGSNPVSIIIIDTILQLKLSKPMGFFFLACICFYFLTQVMRINPYVGLFGSLAYAYATYNAVILMVGHDTKMHAIAYLPAFLASLILLYERKYLWGTALTALFTGLLIAANHLQITYYGFLIALIMSIAYGIRWIKEKQYKHLVLSAALVIGAAILGVMANAITLFSTYEYAQRTIRGGSELADGKTNVTKTGLTKDYAMSYSMYKTEPLVMMFPHLYGGSDSPYEVPAEKSKAIEALQQMPQQLGQIMQQFLSFYWGGIGGTQGPPYAGAIVCFLALLGFVLLDGKYKWWILATCILTILMSWGKYFEGFNSFLLSVLPMYNKFRAPSMILVVPNLLFCMMAVLTLNKVITDPNRELLFQKYKKGLLVVAGAFVLALLVYFGSDFKAQSDKSLVEYITSITAGADAAQKAGINEAMNSFLKGLQEDRKSLLMGDLLRSLLFALVAAAAIFLYIKRKLNALTITIVIGVFAFIDLITIDSKYLNSERYQDSAEYETSFNPRPVDQQVMQDTGYYRIFDITQGINVAFNGWATPSYFHNSIGGYHPAKLSIYQDLMEHQLYRFPNCMPVIDMLNTKYIIADPNNNGQVIAQQNPGALGACWFVKGIEYKKTAAEVMAALSNFNPKDTAILEEKVKSPTLAGSADSTASIRLVYNDNDIIEYRSSSKTNGFAVFSEIYYDAGWIATIDGKESPIIRTNYVLRGLEVPAGEHRIVFEFKPKSVTNSNTAAIGASVLIWLLLIGAAVGTLRKKKETA
jgi:hypothetical protein